MGQKASSGPGGTIRQGLGMWLENIGWVSAGRRSALNTRRLCCF